MATFLFFDTLWVRIQAPKRECQKYINNSAEIFLQQAENQSAEKISSIIFVGIEESMWQQIFKKGLMH